MFCCYETKTDSSISYFEKNEAYVITCLVKPKGAQNILFLSHKDN